MMSDALDRLAGSPAVRVVDELGQAGVAYGQNVQHVFQGRWDQASLDAQDAGAHLLNATGAAVGGTFDPLGVGQAVVADPQGATAIAGIVATDASDRLAGSPAVRAVTSCGRPESPTGRTCSTCSRDAGTRRRWMRRMLARIC
jgi:hypothetical protein